MIPGLGRRRPQDASAGCLVTLVQQVNSRLIGDPVSEAKGEAWRDGSAVKEVPALAEDPSSVRSTHIGLLTAT